MRNLGYLWLAVAIPVAHATILYTDSTEIGGQLQYSGNQIGIAFDQSNPTIGGGYSFVLPTGTFSNLSFDAALWQVGAGTTTVSIDSDNAGKPGTALGTLTVTVPSSVAIVSGSFAPTLTLTGGVTYYLVIQTTASQVTWEGSSPQTDGTQYSIDKYSSGSTLINAFSGSLMGAFDITTSAGATPEPGSLGAVGAGLLIVCAAARRLRAQNRR